MQLSNNPKFIEEYNQIKDFIEKSESEHIKKEVNDLLQKLINEIRIIDNYHNDLTNLRRMPDDISRSREKILDLRKKIFRRMKKD